MMKFIYRAGGILFFKGSIYLELYEISKRQSAATILGNKYFWYEVLRSPGIQFSPLSMYCIGQILSSQ